jgi:HlyD family type I secretion membrane fusion protein
MSVPLSSEPAALPALWGEDDGSGEHAGAFDLGRALKIGGGLFALLLLLAIVVPIGGAVLGQGQVGVESRVKRIAHPFGGVIAEILVTNGEHVKAGQLLMRLDDTVTGADATYASLTVEQLLAQRARLEAERLGASAIAFPPELAGAGTPSAGQAMEDERRLFALRRTEEAQLRAQLAARVVQLNQQVAGTQAQIAALERQRVLIEPERRGVKELWDKDLVTINRLNEMERTAADIDGRIAALGASIAQTRAQITETQERTIQLGQSRRVEAGTELARVLGALGEQQVKNIAAGDMADRAAIRAPYAGIVEKIAFAAIGDVVRPAEPIMEIVPDSDAMVIEAMIRPGDIDQVRTGQKARVRFTAFNLPSTPEIAGRVTYVATDRSESPDDSRAAFYTVRIAIDQQALKAEELTLRSGMPAEVHIQTGSRSLLSYITKPLRDQIARAFRDN